MARIDVALSAGEQTVQASVGDDVVLAFNTGPNNGLGMIDFGSSGGSGFTAQLYTDADLTRTLARPVGSAGDVVVKFAVGQPWLHYPVVAVSTDLWCCVTVNSADMPDQAATYGVSLHLPPAPRSGDATPPHRGGHHQR